MLEQEIMNRIPRSQHAMTLCVICLLTVCAFLPTFWNGFQMEWDDQWMVMNPLTVSPLNWNTLVEIFTTRSHGQWAPVNQMVYTLLFNVCGYNATVFHAVSLFMHITNVCLLYAGLHMLLTDVAHLPQRRLWWINAITSFLFAVHPLQVESVAWVSASKTLLSTLFYLLGFIMLLRHLRGRGRVWLSGTMCMMLLAYMSKEQSVVFPLLATLACLWYGLRPSNRRFWSVLLPLFLFAVLMGLHEVYWVAGYNHYVAGDTYSWWQRFFLFFYSLVTYVFKWICPTGLNWMYLFPMGISDPLPLWLVCYPVFVMMLVYSLSGWLRRGYVLSSLSFVLVHLLLVLHIIVLPRAAVVADRYMYIPIIGLNFLFAYMLTGSTIWLRYRKWCLCVLAVLSIICVTVSYNRTGDWSDTRTLRNPRAIKTEQKQHVVKCEL